MSSENPPATYPFSTAWTGNGDGNSWSDPANWSNGLPLPSAPAPTASDDVATISSTAQTVIIAGSQSVAQLNLAAAGPAGGVAVSLTGTLDMTTNASPDGASFGVIDLTAGTFEIDGGTLNTGEVQQNGGTLVLGAGTDTLNSTIIDGAITFATGSNVVGNQTVFDGDGGYGNAVTDVIANGATVSANGFYLDGEFDVKNGTLSLEGGLNGWGCTATLFQDGGTLDISGDAGVNGTYTIEGGLTFTGAHTLSVAGGAALTLGNAALPAPTVINLDGGTIDVTGALSLIDTQIENGTVILESGSTYSKDAASSLTGVTVTDNRPAGQTNWTGAAGDGAWSNAANWTNGVPQSGLGYNADGQSVAVINNAIATTPATIDITGTVNAQDITLATTDPANGPSILLTGTLDTSWSGEGGAFGQLNLESGTFEVAGGSISFTGIALNGGTLSFGTSAQGQNTFNQDIFNGSFDIDNSLVVMTGFDTLHGQGGSGETTDTLSGGTTLLQANGELDLDGTLDVQDYGGQGTLFVLAGGNLSGYGGDAATIFIDGGEFDINASTTFYNAVDIYGGNLVFGSASGLVATIDASSTTTIGQTGANQTVVNLNGGTLDVFGTLDLTNTIIENGAITVENGAFFNQDATVQLNNVTLTGASSTPGTIDAGQNPFTLSTGQTINGDTIIDPAGDVTFQGGTLEGVTYQGGLELSQDYAAVIIDNGLTLEDSNGNTPGTIDVNGNQASVTFDNTQTFDNGAINLTGYDDSIYLGTSAAAYGAAGNTAVPLTVTLGAAAVINTSGYDDVLGDAQSYNTDYGATTLINNGTINVTGGTLEIDPGTFVNNGTITVAADSTLDLEGNWSNPGTITLAADARIELGGSFTSAQLATFNQNGDAIEIDGTLDNSGNTLNVGTGATYAQLTLMNGGTIKGGTITDAGGGIAFGGGTLDGVTYDGPIDFSNSYVTAYVSDGLDVTGVDGTGSGVIDLAEYRDWLLFNDTQTLDDATITLSGGDDTLAGIASSSASANAGNVPTSQTLTLGANLVIDQTGGYNYLGGLDPNDSSLNNLDYGTTTLVNKGAIDVSGGELIVNPTNFINDGTIYVASGATLFLDSNWTNPGTITLASGSSIDLGGTFTVADLAQFNQPGVTLEIGGVLDNTGATLDVGQGDAIVQLTLESGGSIKGGTIGQSGGLLFNGGTLDGVTYDGAINLDTAYQQLGVSGGSVFDTDQGQTGGSITLSAYDQGLSFLDTQTIDNVTINLSGTDDAILVTTATAYAYGSTTPPTTLTWGAGVVVNSNGPQFIYGDTGTGSLINQGTIDDQSGTLNIETTNFINTGTIDVAPGANLYLYGNWSNSGTISVDDASIFLGGNFDDAAIDSITNTGGNLYIDGTLDNVGSVLAIGQGSALPLVQLNDGTIEGGTISDAGSGLALHGTGTLDGVTYQGAFDLTGGGFYTYYYSGSSYTPPSLIIENGLTLTGANGVGPGTFNVLGASLPVDFTGTQTLDNATVNLGYGDSINAYTDYQHTSPASLTLGSGLIVNVTSSTSSGSEANFGGSGTITNDGTINVAAGTFVIDPANFSNIGTINVAAGATLYLEGNWSNAGTINLGAGSSVYLQGSFSAASVANIVNNGGTIYATTVVAPMYVTITQGFAAAISGVSLTDPGAASGETITATLTDTSGLLAATGSVVSGSGTTKLVVTGSLTDVNAALATLTDTNPAVGDDNITVSAVDSSGNSAPNKTIDVAVEAPIIIYSPYAQGLSPGVTTSLPYASVYEEGALSGADLTVTVSDTTGILAASGPSVSGSGTTALTFSGSQSQIDNDLKSLTINEAFSGTDTVTFAAQDAAGDKAINATTVVTTVALPSVSAPGNEAVTQNEITALSGFSVSEPGSLYYETFTVTLSDTSGLLQAAGSSATGRGATSISVTGSLQQVNADLATLTLDATTAGMATLNVAVTDSFGGTASQTVAIAATHVPSPDLTVSAITAPSSAVEGQSVTLTYTVTNSGDATATGPWTDDIYLATDADGSNKTLVGSFTYTGTLAPGQSVTETRTVTVPSAFTIDHQTGTATTYFVVQPDINNQVGALSGLQNNLGVDTMPTAVTGPINWAQIFSNVAPANIDSVDYGLFQQRFIAEVGTTDATYSTAINNAIQALDQRSTTPATPADAYELLIRQAFGGVGDRTLAQVNGPAGSSTALDALLMPSYSADFSSRNNAGAFGDGWESEFNTVGPLGRGNGSGNGASFAGGQAYVQEYITTYVDQYGDYLGQTISYQVVSPPGVNINFLDPKNPNSDYTQANADGTVDTFSGTSGLLIAISDGHGNAINIARNANGIITGITTALGHPPTFTVNAFGDITSATDSAGHTIVYTYDASGTHLLSTTTAAGTTSYQYSSSSNAFVQNALTQVTNPDGTTAAFGYDALGDVTTQSINGAAPTTFVATSADTGVETSATGQATTYTYDANGLVTSATDASGSTVTVQRDSKGNATSITTPAGQTYQFTYDSSGNLVTATNPLGGVVTYGYAAGTSTLTSITDQNGNVTQYLYNSAGQFLGTHQANATGTHYTYNANGQIAQKTDASGATTTYSYNAAGQVVNELFSDGTSQSYAYDANGNLTSSTAVGGGVTAYAYNAQGLLASVTNPAGQVESYSYNSAGQETQRVEPDGSITNYAYNAVGLLAQITDGNGTLIAKYTYDAAGTLIEKDTGNGASTIYSHNTDGKLTEIKTLATDGSTTSKLDYTYDSDGRIATATSGDGTWTYSYDGNNQLVHATFASTNAAIANQDLSYQYDAAGNRTQTIFNGATTSYATNNLNQYTSANGTTYSYDANGNLVSKVSGGNTTSYSYNLQNQLVASTDASGTTTYTYDALGNMASQTVNGVKTSYVSDPLAINSTATGPLSAVAQAYNASGQATATYTYGNGLTAVTSNGTTSYYNADASGNITSLSGANGALSATYAYTPTGTLLNSTGNSQNPFQFNGQLGAITQADGLVSTRARYYDPTTGRFISQDPSGPAGGTNLYEYAANDSVNFIDANGQSISPSGVIVAGAGVILSVLGGFVAFATAPVAAVVFATAGVVVGTRSYYQQFNKPGPPGDIYVDSNAEIASNVFQLATAPVQGTKVLSAAQLALGTLSTTDYYDPNYGSRDVPPIDETVTVHRTKGGGRGDVHLTTFDGLHYDFQAVGEFILAKSTVAGDNFQVQIRLSAFGGPESSPTLTSEMAVQVGADRVTFDPSRAATVWIDGVASTLSASNSTTTLAGGTVTELSQDSYQVTENTGEVVDITVGGLYLNYTVELAPGAQQGTVEGLLGSDSGNGLALPDGTSLGSSLTSQQLYQTFGNAWRITDATSLLDYGTGETTATYTDLNHPSNGLPVGSLPANVVAAATAAAEAAGITDPTAAADAAYDYLITGDPSFLTTAAADTSAAPVTADAVITSTTTAPPSLGISPVSPSLAQTSGQTAVTFTVSLTSAATADTVVNYTVSTTADDAGKSYFDAADFGGTLPSGTVTIAQGQTEATITVEVPDAALGTNPDKWLAVGISTPGTAPIYAATAQVDVVNNAPVAGTLAQPVLEYVPGDVVSATQNAPTLTQSGNTYSLNLGNVVQGSSVAVLQFALANMAAAPADTLAALVRTAVGNGFGENGLQTATLINAGNAYSGINLQPLTNTLGAQSEVLTIGNVDVNNTGYAGTLSNITLNVTDNVIAAAQASVSTSAIVLPDVRVGSSDTQTITVTNGAASGAAPLDVTLSAAAGAAATGSITQLAPGGSDSTSLSLGLATTTAGLVTSSVTLDLASDLGGGVSVPLASNQTVSVTGSVYRAAAATVTQAATIVHVGDAASQTLTILNGDPADGYSEGLRATVTGTTGGIIASGTTGLIAAGASDTSAITVGYSTASAGVVSGQVNLGLTSDGTGIDNLAPLALPADAVAFSVQVDNYAAAAVDKASGAGTLSGSAATGYTLDLGNVLQGSGSLTTTLGIGNAATGLADLLGGGFVVTNASTAFTNTLESVTGLGAGQTDNGSSISLDTTNQGVFTETLTLQAAGSNASGYSGSLAPITLTITGTVVAGHQTFTLTSKADTISGGANINTVNAASGTLSAGDKIDGGSSGDNTLALLGAGSFNLAAPTSLTDIALVAAQEESGTVQTVTMRSGLNVTVNVASVAGGKITLFGANDADVFNLGNGADTITLGSAAETVNGGSGADTIYATAATAGATIAGGSGSTTLILTGGGAVSLGSNVTGVQTVYLRPAATGQTQPAWNFTANSIAGLNIIDQSGAGDTITLNNASQSVTTAAGSDVVVATASTAGAKVIGGTGTVLEVEGGGSFALNAATRGVTVQLDQASTVTLAAITGIGVTGSTGGDTIIANRALAKDSFDLGGTGNTLELTGAGTFDLRTLTQITGIQTIDVSEGQNAYTPAGGTAVPSTAQTIYLSNGLTATVDVGSGTAAADNPNPESISIVGANDSATIDLGSGTDKVTLGSATETVNGGSGADTIYATAATAGATIHGGSGSTTLILTGGGAVSLGSNVTGVQTVYLRAAATGQTQPAWNFTANAMAGLNIIDQSGAGDTITLNNASETVTTVAGSDVVVATAASAGAEVIGGVGTVLEVEGGGSFALNAATRGVTVQLDQASTVTLAAISGIGVTGSTGGDTIIATRALAKDNFDLGGTGNTLELSGAGTFDLRALTQITGIQTIDVSEGQNTYTPAGGTAVPSTAQTIYLSNDLTATVDVGSGTAATSNPNPESISIIGANDSATIDLGNGTDTVTLGSAAETVNAGSGIALINATAATAGALIKGNGTATAITVAGGGTVDLNAGDSGVTGLTLRASTSAYSVTTGSQSGLTISDQSSAGDMISVGGANATVIDGAGSDTLWFHAGLGQSVVRNFTASGAAHDTLQFDKSVFADWSHLLGATKQVGSDLVITLDASDTLVLKNVSLSKFTASDAVFV